MSAPEQGLYARVEAQVGSLRLDAEFATGRGTLVLIGPNGAGKTSLISLIVGVPQIEQGRVSVSNDVLFDSAARVNVPIEQRRLGYVPQDYALFPHLSVQANIEFAIRSADPDLSRHETRRRTEHMLSELELQAHAAHLPEQLSGGERQRVALARALSIRPRALLLDEPLGALDVHTRREVRAFLASYLRTLELPTVVITHDPEDARALASHIAVLESGRVTQAGAWEDLTRRPASQFVAEFTSCDRTPARPALPIDSAGLTKSSSAMTTGTRGSTASGEDRCAVLRASDGASCQRLGCGVSRR